MANALATFEIAGLSFEETLSWGVEKHQSDPSFRYSIRDRGILRKVMLIDAFASRKGWGYCGITGQKPHPVLSEFHHRDPGKKERELGYYYHHQSLVKLRSASLKEELSSCCVLTKEAHASLHFGLYKDDDIDSVFSMEHFLHNTFLLERHLTELYYGLLGADGMRKGRTRVSKDT